MGEIIQFKDHKSSYLSYLQIMDKGDEVLCGNVLMKKNDIPVIAGLISNGISIDANEYDDAELYAILSLLLAFNVSADNVFVSNMRDWNEPEIKGQIPFEMDICGFKFAIIA